MKRTIFIAAIIIFFGVSAYSENLFKPYTANPLEARVGAMYQTDDEKVRLDIGNASDLLTLKDSDSCKIMLGFDFFIITRLRSQSNFKFPVETSDYFFGLNSTSKFKLFGENMSARLRFAHISSHLVDGLADSLTFRKEPFVYSREFIDLTFAWDLTNFRPYLGATYIYSTKPKNISAIIPQLGFDFDYKFCSNLSAIGGYDFKLIGVSDVFAGSNAMQVGVKLNTEKSFGISLNYYYFSGRSIHGMFYDSKDNYSAIGFELIY